MIRRLGVIVNPRAGSGLENALIAGRLAAGLKPDLTLVGPGDMQPDGLDVPMQIVDHGSVQGRARTPELARRMAAEGADAIAVIGGDGTMADVAFALWQIGATVAILGVGVGSANVGPLVTCRGSDVERLTGASLVACPVDGLIVGANGAVLGLGFNDAVVSYTVLATVNGSVVDVDAAEKMRGHNVPRDSAGVWTENTRVVKQGPQGERLVARGDQVETVIVGLPDERFYGKAIAGGVILTSWLGDPAGCLVCDHLLVTTRLDPDAYRRSEPVVSRYVGLGEEETIVAWGFRTGAALCADGNPLIILNEADRVEVRARRGIAWVMRAAAAPASAPSLGE